MQWSVRNYGMQVFSLVCGLAGSHSHILHIQGPQPELNQRWELSFLFRKALSLLDTEQAKERNYTARHSRRTDITHPRLMLWSRSLHESAGKQTYDSGRDAAVVLRRRGWKEWKKARHHPGSHDKDVRPAFWLWGFIGWAGEGWGGRGDYFLLGLECRDAKTESSLKKGRTFIVIWFSPGIQETFSEEDLAVAKACTHVKIISSTISWDQLLQLFQCSFGNLSSDRSPSYCGQKEFHFPNLQADG